MKSDEEIINLLVNLSKSKFRGSFHLNNNMKIYAKEKGFKKIQQDAYEIINKRLAQEYPKNDGKQTPMRANSHPVFIAQHACGFCCRGCMEKIHGISKGKKLTDEEIDYAVKMIMSWITKEVKDILKD